MMTFDVYICALEQKLARKETTTKDNKHIKRKRCWNQRIEKLLKILRRS